MYYSIYAYCSATSKSEKVKEAIKVINHYSNLYHNYGYCFVITSYYSPEVLLTYVDKTFNEANTKRYLLETLNGNAELLTVQEFVDKVFCQN